MASKTIAKGFGARYGARLRERYGKIVSMQRKHYKCPYCHYPKSKRVAVGIWTCSKCRSTFTSKAYKVEKVAPIKTVEEMPGVVEAEG